MKRLKTTEDIIAYTAAPHLELVGNRECAVEGLRGIVEYTKDKIKIDLGKYCVSFVGDGLYINSFTHEGATIEGTILSVEFEGNA